MFVFLRNYMTKLKTCTVIAPTVKHVIRKHRHSLILYRDVTYAKLTQHRGLCCCGTSLPVDTPRLPKAKDALQPSQLRPISSWSTFLIKLNLEMFCANGYSIQPPRILKVLKDWMTY